jgi:hypothetical protein
MFHVAPFVRANVRSLTDFYTWRVGVSYNDLITVYPYRLPSTTNEPDLSIGIVTGVTPLRST